MSNSETSDLGAGHGTRAEGGGREAALVERLLSGTEPTAGGPRAEEPGTFVIVCADAPARDLALAELAACIETPARASEAGRVVAVIDEDTVVALVRSTSPGVTQGDIGRAIDAAGAGARAGLSLVYSRLSDIPRARAEARAMLEQAAPGTVRSLGDLSTIEYLTLTADETARQLIDPDLRRVLERDHAAGGVLITTITAYLDANQNALNASKALRVHPNTVHYRLAKLARETRRDPHSFHDLVEILTALRVLGLVPRTTPEHDTGIVVR